MKNSPKSFSYIDYSVLDHSLTEPEANLCEGLILVFEEVETL